MARRLGAEEAARRERRRVPEGGRSVEVGDAAAPAAAGDAGEAAVVARIGASTSAVPEPGNWLSWEEEDEEEEEKKGEGLRQGEGNVWICCTFSCNNT